MARVFEQAVGIPKRTWECKECHQHIAADCTVAYHLIEGILYGWCEPCFSHRGDASNQIAA